LGDPGSYSCIELLKELAKNAVKGLGGVKVVSNLIKVEPKIRAEHLKENIKKILGAK